jgi:exodeoxyribonuclease-3
MTKIITYNVNGIRAAVKKGFLEWLETTNPDVVCIQETKAQPDQIPVFELEAMGYKTFIHSAKKKGYSGVAILSKKQPDHIESGMGIEKYDQEGRFIRADFGDVSIVSVYHPSGSSGDVRQDFKMQWLADFQDYVTELKKTRPKLIICGDYNICHRPIDIHDPVRNATSSGFLPEEREWMSSFLDSGFIDSFRHLNKEPHQYSWWSYRANARANNKGWRIDYNMVTENLKDKIRHAAILPDAMHSDHCPVLLEIDV